MTASIVPVCSITRSSVFSGELRSMCSSFSAMITVRRTGYGQQLGQALDNRKNDDRNNEIHFS